MANIVLSVECKRCQHIWILETAKNVSAALHKVNIDETYIAILKKLHLSIYFDLVWNTTISLQLTRNLCEKLTAPASLLSSG